MTRESGPHGGVYPLRQHGLIRQHRRFHYESASRMSACCPRGRALEDSRKPPQTNLIRLIPHSVRCRRGALQYSGHGRAMQGTFEHVGYSGEGSFLRELGLTSPAQSEHCKLTRLDYGRTTAGQVQVGWGEGGSNGASCAHFAPAFYPGVAICADELRTYAQTQRQHQP